MKLAREKYLLPDEYARLLRAARERRSKNQKRDLAMLALGGHLGTREIELATIRMADLLFPIDLAPPAEPALVRIQTAKRRDRETGEPLFREIALHNTARRALVEYIRTLPPEDRKPWARLFPLTTRRVRQIFKYYARRAGLSAAYSAHALRHTRGLMLYDVSRNPKLVQQELGHATLKATEIYIHTVDGAKIAGNVGIEEEDDHPS